MRTTGQPPLPSLYCKHTASCTIYTQLNLLSGYNQSLLAISSHNLITINTHLSPMCLTTLLQGWTLSVNIFHNNIAFILQHNTEIASNFIDNINVLGSCTYYCLLDGTYKTHPENDQAQKFVWEHLLNIHQILHCLKCAGATVSAKKLKVGVPNVIVLRQLCDYNGQLPKSLAVNKIWLWPPCCNVKGVRGFHGLAGTICIWIKGFAELAKSLVILTTKKATFC